MFSIVRAVFEKEFCSINWFPTANDEKALPVSILHKTINEPRHYAVTMSIKAYFLTTSARPECNRIDPKSLLSGPNTPDFAKNSPNIASPQGKSLITFCAETASGAVLEWEWVVAGNRVLRNSSSRGPNFFTAGFFRCFCHPQGFAVHKWRCGRFGVTRVDEE